MNLETEFTRTIINIFKEFKKLNEKMNKHLNELKEDKGGGNLLIEV